MSASLKPDVHYISKYFKKEKSSHQRLPLFVWILVFVLILGAGNLVVFKLGGIIAVRDFALGEAIGGADIGD